MIKKFFTFLCLCVLCIGSAWADSATLSISATVTSDGYLTDDQNLTWAVSSDGTYTANKTYIQVGSNNKEVKYLQLVSSGYATKKITKVQVWGTSKASSNVTPKIYIGENLIGEGTAYTTQNASSGGTEYSASNNNNYSGEIKVEISRPSAVKGAIYFNKLIVTYEDAAGSKYTVTYDGNEASSGSVPTDATEYEKDATVTVLGNTGNLAKVGYTFDGWNTKADATGTDYAAGSTFAILQNTTLYAKWNAIPYTITKTTVEGGSCSVKVGEVDATTATKGTKLTLSNTPNNGYKFVQYLIDYTNEKGEAKQSKITTNTYYMPASDIVVTPEFSKLATYTITLNNRGNVTTIDNVIENSNLYDALVGQEPSDEFDGYSFGGWSKVQKASADNLVSSSDLVTGDITLYAVYCKSEGTLSTSEVTSLSNLSAGLYILGSEKTTNTLMYMPNTESTSSNPTLKALDLNEVSVDMVWNLTSTGTANEYYIRPYGNDEIGLGVTTSTSKNIRISKTYKETEWTISESTSYNWQFKSGSMYLAVYDDSAWRNYESASTNQNGKFHIYKVNLPKKSYSLGLAYTRDVTSGNFGTICLEEDATVTGATLYSVLGVDNQENPSTLYLKEVETAEAGVPYIFKATSTQLVASFKGNAVSVPAAVDASNGLVGSFVKAEIEVDAKTKKYILKNNLWCYVPEGNTNYVGANKAYLNLAYVPVKAEAKGDYEMIFDGDVTSINLVPTTEKIGGTMYNLNGMKVNASYKGIVVKNGKKFINK